MAMKWYSKVQVLLLGFLLTGVSGCVSYPVSKSLRERAQPVALAQAAQNPNASKGTVVIWGGRIIQTVNDTNGSAIYVLELPLTRDERPVRHAVPRGRFIVRSSRFLDPEFFRAGRLITVAGEIAGVETHPLQKVQYVYPVLAAKELHVWYVPRPYPGGPWPGWGWYGPGWYGGGWYGPGWDLD